LHSAPHGRLLVVTLCAASSFSVLNALALSPFLARMAPAMHVSVATMGQAGTVAGLFGATLGLGIGSLAESVGFRRLMVAGALALVAALIGTALAPAYLPLMAAQLLGGLAGSTVSPMAFAFAGTLFHGAARRRVITQIYSSTAAAEIIAFPIITRIADASSWRWSYASLAVSATSLIALAVVALPRDPQPARRPSRLRTLPRYYAPLARDASARMLYAAQFLRGVAWSGSLAYVGAFIEDELGYSVRAAGYAITVLGSGYLAGSLLVGGRLRTLPPRATFIAAVSVLGALSAATFLTRPPLLGTYALLLALSFVGGIAEVTAITLISAETPAPQAPTMALHSSILRYGTATGALVGGGFLTLGSYTALGCGYLVIAGLAAAACLRSRGAGRTREADAVAALD
jgi:DHA1 family L-arabinose/isopropyl-beta-D-thiogalactopyranoside export protein-like MFS transporter/DHA1 family inner membrane transport protein